MANQYDDGDTGGSGFWDALPMLGLGLLGGGIDAAGWGIGEILNNVLGLSPDFSSGQSSSQQATEHATNFAIDTVVNRGEELTGAGMYNAMGGTGKGEVQAAAELALGNLTPGATAISDAGRMRRAATDMMGTATRQGVSAMRAAGREAGNLRQDITNALALQNANPAAIAASAGKINQATGGTLADTFSRAMSTKQQALGQASSTYGAASQLMDQARNSRFQTDVVPYMAQVNQGVTGLAGALAPALGTSAGESAQRSEEQFRTNPLSGLASVMGQATGGLMQNWALGLLPDEYEQFATENLQKRWGRRNAYSNPGGN